MLSAITNNSQIKYPQTLKPVSFKGDKDILLINDENASHLILLSDCIKRLLDDKADEYTIHTAVGGKEGLEKAKKVMPLFTITPYHMPKDLWPQGEKLIKELKALGTKVIVKTFAWYGEEDESRKKGAYKCETICGADKYIYEPDIMMLKDTMHAIIEGKPIPRYHFQKESVNNSKEKDK